MAHHHDPSARFFGFQATRDERSVQEPQRWNCWVTGPGSSRGNCLKISRHVQLTGAKRREWMGMDGLLGVAGLIITSDCGSFPDSFPAFRTGKIIANDHDFFRRTCNIL